MATLKYKAIIRIQGVNPYVDITKNQARLLKEGWRRPIPVIIQINGRPKDPWHINMVPKGDGDYYLYLHGDVRKASGTKVGDEVIVEIDLDKNYKNGPINPLPDSLAIAMNKNVKAKANWENLSPSRQKEILRYFGGLKTAEAKQRNLEKVMSVLSGKPHRFMGRSWRDGS